MNTQDIKQDMIQVAFKLLNGAYALPVIVIVTVWLWSNLTPDQIERIRELEPLLNSSLGIAFAVILVVSYVSSVISSPIKEMTQAISSLKAELHEVIEIMDTRIQAAEEQHANILNRIERIQGFFESK